MNVLNNFQSFAGRNKYEILVLSFLLIMFGNTFFNAIYLTVLLPVQNMVVAAVIFAQYKKLRTVIVRMVALVLLITLINCCYFTKQASGVILSVYFIYFVLVSFKVYAKIFSTESVSSEMLAILVCGFVLLCLTCAIIFITIEVNYPHSYSHLSGGAQRFDDLQYFSLTTVLTIGYGDITPLTLLAKRAVMLAGLAGHLYTVLVTGIVIGKYLQGKGMEERKIPDLN